MEKLFALFMKLSSPHVPFRADIQVHFWCGVIIGLMTTPFIGPWSIGAIALIALLKEVYDYYHPNHTADFSDWVATMLGGLTVLILSVFF